MRFSLKIGCQLVLFILPYHALHAQYDSLTGTKKFTVKGYVKYLEEGSFTKDATELFTNQLLHNRLNFRYQPDSAFNLRLEIRNRLYYGEMVKSYPGYASYVTQPTGTFNLSENWINRNAVLANSTIDRASAEYNKGKWDITLGRQRINWGINTVWTPNDIFNTFNYFDFDYEERPGTDAARIQYAVNTASSLDLAISPGKTSRQNIEALMYHFNKWGYDFQLFPGIYQNDFTAGGGWAGNIKEAGFKGELSYFTPYRHMGGSNAFAASLSFDYGFKKGLYLLVSGLYNNTGADSLPNITQFTSEALSAKNIFPFKYTAFVEISYPFTPILKGSLGSMYSPSGNSLIILPTITYSVADNWALDIVGQSFFAESKGSYVTHGNAIFFRLKWGF